MSTREPNIILSRPALAGLLGALTFIIGCGGPAGSCANADAGPVDGNKTAVAAAVAPFIGDWTFASGAQSVACGIEPTLSSMPNDRIKIAPGPVSETISVDDDGCVLTYSVTGTVATSPLAGTCNGAIVETSIEVRSDGLLHFSGVTGIELDGGACTLTVDGYLARR